MAKESPETPCVYCHAPGRIYAVKEGYVVPGTEHLAKPTALCARCYHPHQQELFWHAHPRGRDFAKKEIEDLAAEVAERKQAQREAARPKPASSTPEPQLIEAAVQRLMGEAQRLADPHPKPRSPAWIGRDLEVEGWDRKLLVAALAQAVEDGDLVLDEQFDASRNMKRVVRPAPTGVAVDLFA
jgi:hypothetical protein